MLLFFLEIRLAKFLSELIVFWNSVSLGIDMIVSVLGHARIESLDILEYFNKMSRHLIGSLESVSMNLANDFIENSD